MTDCVIYSWQFAELCCVILFTWQFSYKVAGNAVLIYQSTAGQLYSNGFDRLLKTALRSILELNTHRVSHMQCQPTPVMLLAFSVESFSQEDRISVIVVVQTLPNSSLETHKTTQLIIGKELRTVKSCELKVCQG